MLKHPNGTLIPGPISLRKQMRISSMRARALVQQIRDSGNAAANDDETTGLTAHQIASYDLRQDSADEREGQAMGLGRELAAVTS